MTEATLNGFIRRDLVFDGRVKIRINGPADGVMPWAAAAPIAIRNARTLQATQSPKTCLDRHGFALLDHDSQVRDWDSGAADTLDKNEIARIYMPEIDALIRHSLLPDLKLEIVQSPGLVRRGPGTHNPYALGVHQDYGLTPDDYQESLEAFSSPEVGQSWRQRFDRPEVAGFVVVNFWRTVYMDAPLQHMPLAVCDPASVAAEDLVPAALVGFSPTGKDTNQLSLRHSDQQAWYYYPAMTTKEVLAFKVFQYFKDGRRTGLQTCFHTAFSDPQTPQDAPQRQSCEHRVGIFILND
ncbi:CmcJ/NvfI family oxidoreductase [Asticcacaulis sp. 201]|uniref:CmcJ/NvfI family oxidoreductase n=1 Tax=Asticcacaulis sp. 201 TaxID=3028787 RepID=UPI0029169C6C|nr:CmcJ/NvfI family oxidoreductase [Asticcacaulis sp. 201]MDV6331856.1 CmcJ/NvfI family oxidoreductase [Asticcacaulis sp. 201]